eukprot:4914048-Prymnesium_polylepis.1
MTWLASRPRTGQQSAAAVGHCDRGSTCGRHSTRRSEGTSEWRSWVSNRAERAAARQGGRRWLAAAVSRG